jgi:hypothetical protein
MTKIFDKQDLVKAAHEIGLTSSQAEMLWQSLNAKKSEGQSFNMFNVICYFGALVICIALAWFLEKSYFSYGIHALLLISTAYAVGFYGAGLYFWKVKKQQIIGGLGIFLALLMVPIVTYAFQETMGWWTKTSPGEYFNFYSWTQGNWFFMELATFVCTLATLYLVRFPFLTVILYLSMWCMSMNVASLIENKLAMNADAFWNVQRVVCMLFGLALIIVGMILDRKKKGDFAFWGYLLGVLFFWGSITSFHYESELGNLVYCLVNVFMIIMAPILQRKIFLVFGVLGVLIYFAEVIRRHFAESAALPFILSALGIAVIVAAFAWKSNKHRIKSFFGRIFH